MALPSAPRAAGLARQEARDALASWGLERLEDIAVLLVSELVGNAVQHARHGGSELRLRMTDTGRWLRIEVSDADPRPPQFQCRPGLDESGFGLVLVDALAAKWGVDQAATGKTVWAELGTRQADACDGPPLRTRQPHAMTPCGSVSHCHPGCRPARNLPRPAVMPAIPQELACSPVRKRRPCAAALPR